MLRQHDSTAGPEPAMTSDGRKPLSVILKGETWRN
jgi:hypothetical protein